MQVMGVNLDYKPMSPQAVPHKEMINFAGRHVNVGSWERIASALLGGFLMFNALRNRRRSSLLYGGVAAGLLNRGITGYCNMYGKMGVTSTR